MDINLNCAKPQGTSPTSPESSYRYLTDDTITFMLQRSANDTFIAYNIITINNFSTTIRSGLESVNAEVSLMNSFRTNVKQIICCTMNYFEAGCITLMTDVMVCKDSQINTSFIKLQTFGSSNANSFTS